MLKKINIRALAALLALLLALAGCRSADMYSVAIVTSSEPAVSSGPAAPAPSAAPAASSQAPQNGGGAEPLIPGIGLDDYPTINGSTANHPLIARLYSELCGIPKEDAETLVNLDLGSTGSIWRNFLNGSGPDLLIAYEPPEEIKAEFADELLRFEIDPLGRDGLVFLANAKNPVESLTVEQLQKIYTAQLTNWSEVGGSDEPIVPFQRNADSGSQTLFLKLLMDGLTPMDPPTELVQMSMGGLIDGVAAFDGEGSSLGFSVFYYASLMYANPDLKLLSVDGIAPSGGSIRSGEYPLTNDFYVAIRADEPEDSHARLVRDWLLTEEGRLLMEEENYVWARDGLPEKTDGDGSDFAQLCGLPLAGEGAAGNGAPAPGSFGVVEPGEGHPAGQTASVEWVEITPEPQAVPPAETAGGTEDAVAAPSVG